MSVVERGLNTRTLPLTVVVVVVVVAPVIGIQLRQHLLPELEPHTASKEVVVALIPHLILISLVGQSHYLSECLFTWAISQLKARIAKYARFAFLGNSKPPR